jgi:hypothetical protein
MHPELIKVDLHISIYNELTDLLDESLQRANKSYNEGKNKFTLNFFIMLYYYHLVLQVNF